MLRARCWRRKIDGCGRSVHQAFQQRRAVDRDENAAAPIYGALRRPSLASALSRAPGVSGTLSLSAEVLKADLPGIRNLALQLVGHDQLIGSLNR